MAQRRRTIQPEEKKHREKARSRARSNTLAAAAAPGRTRAYRLPTTLRADRIDLDFELDPSKKTFRGTASYELTLDRGRRKIELHSVDLRVARVRLHLGNEVLQGRVEVRPDSETIALHFDRLIPRGSARLELAFRGGVRRDLRGLYTAGTGDEAWLATQLCPIDARRFFPCLDEPGFKARYRIRVTAPAGQTVISNAPAERESIEPDGRRRVRFAITPPLSSYLVAVAVGPFEASPVTMCGDTAIRTYALPGRSSLTTFACEAAAESLARLENWFGLPHPYPKLDLLALPAFAFGAMENAGAVFFRDSILLLDDADANLEDRKRTAEVVAHELSHMWFGNLVTMAWWNDLWLNEAFATWMAYEIVEQWRPEWKIWLDFAERREHALVLDALASTHPIAPPIRRAEEAQENFDAITYTKGASVLRMLERYLGADVFREGIRLYMRRHAEVNAEASDLWAALREVSGEDIEAIVAPWTLESGYPLLSLARRDGHLAVQQDRFLALAPATNPKQVKGRGTKTGRKKGAATTWRIPWIVRAGHGGAARTSKTVVTKRRDTLPGVNVADDWIYPNDAESGFLRFDLGVAGHRAIVENVSELSAMERIGFLGNQWALCQSGRLEIRALLDLIAALADEDDPDVLGAIEDILAQIVRRLEPAIDAESLQPGVDTPPLRQWIRHRFSPAMERVGFEPRASESERDRLARARRMAIVGGIGDSEPVWREAERRCAQHFAEGRGLSTELAGVQLRLAARRGGPILHAALRQASRKATNPQARRLHLFALADFSKPSLIAQSLDTALDVEAAPAPDRAQLIAELLANPTSAMPTWQRLQRSWSRLEKQMPPILLARLAGATAQALPPNQSKAILGFFAVHPLAAGSRVLSQVAESLRIAARFERDAGPALEAYLRRSGA